MATWHASRIDRRPAMNQKADSAVIEYILLALLLLSAVFLLATLI